MEQLCKYVELAEKMWSEYQVVVATHFNTGTYHNHFVVNSVNMFTGKKFDCNKGAYFRFRGISDELCEKYNLTVIRNPKGRTPRSIYFAEKRGEPTKKYRNKLRNCKDEKIIAEYKETISYYTKILQDCRKDIKNANLIIQDTEKMKENIKIQKQYEKDQKETKKSKNKKRNKNRNNI